MDAEAEIISDKDEKGLDSDEDAGASHKGPEEPVATGVAPYTLYIAKGHQEFKFCLFLKTHAKDKSQLMEYFAATEDVRDKVFDAARDDLRPFVEKMGGGIEVKNFPKDILFMLRERARAVRDSFA